MLSLKSPLEIAADLAVRVRERRLQRAWTQDELASRAGLKTATYILFERTGRISLIRLLKILEVLDLLPEFDRIGRGQDLAGVSLDELAQPERQRGRRKTS
ncbi:MAG: helix-turn-helix domain-containing protein [Opitutaceae bacterium]|nr:helix-turn-helix domain-containing protein [Opitutaceae bacterium]